MSLQNFSFECIGTTQTDDELVITKSLAEFGRLIAAIEDERDRMVSEKLSHLSLEVVSLRDSHSVCSRSVASLKIKTDGLRINRNP